LRRVKEYVKHYRSHHFFFRPIIYRKMWVYCWFLSWLYKINNNTYLVIFDIWGEHNVQGAISCVNERHTNVEYSGIKTLLRMGKNFWRIPETYGFWPIRACPQLCIHL
jgi:hypothetical protein